MIEKPLSPLVIMKMLCESCHFEIDGKPIMLTRVFEYKTGVKRLALCVKCYERLKRDE